MCPLNMLQLYRTGAELPKSHLYPQRMFVYYQHSEKITISDKIWYARTLHVLRLESQLQK